MSYRDYSVGYNNGYTEGYSDGSYEADVKNRRIALRADQGIDKLKRDLRDTTLALDAAKETITRLLARLEEANNRRTNPPISIPVQRLGKKPRSVSRPFVVGDRVSYRGSSAVHTVTGISNGGHLYLEGYTYPFLKENFERV